MYYLPIALASLVNTTSTDVEGSALSCESCIDEYASESQSINNISSHESKIKNLKLIKMEELSFSTISVSTPNFMNITRR